MIPQSLLVPSLLLLSALPFASAQACNNSPSLCSKSYNAITHLGAHDSPFVSNKSNSFTNSGNQFFDSPTQLDAGVRLLSAQIHTANDSAPSTELRLCHSDCGLYDGGSLVDWLRSVKAWLDANPSEVVTLLLVNSVNADAARLNADFSASGITKYTFQPSSSSISQWPTLQAMISANARLVTFIANLQGGNAAAPYLLDQFTYVWENPFEVTAANNFTCVPERPSAVAGSLASAASSGRMFLMNHFLGKDQLFGIIAPDVANAGTTNSPDANVVGSLANHAQTCTRQYGSAPTFILVDWFNVGPTINTVDALNGVTGAVGRKQVSSEVFSQSFQSKAAGRGDRSMLALVFIGALLVLF